jgi:hypothetical protein
MADLIARLRDAQAEGVGSAKLFNLIDEAAAALEAAREDAERSRVYATDLESDRSGLIETCAELRSEANALRSLLVPGLHVYEGTHVVQVAVGARLFTSRYQDEADKQRALRHAIATACAAIDQARGKGVAE